MRDEEVVSNVCKVKVNLLPPPLSTHLTPRVCGGGGRRREEEGGGLKCQGWSSCKL